MSFHSKYGNCFCERCGHSWHSSKMTANNVEFIQPTSCARCKSKVWNQPRVYAGKYISGTLARRFKPTGRAAAKLKQEKVISESLNNLYKKSDRVEVNYKALENIMESKNYDVYSINFFAHAIGQAYEKSKKILFEIADLTEPDPLENFYMKRGKLYTQQDRANFILRNFNRLQYEEMNSGRINDSHDGTQRYQDYQAAIKEAQHRVEEARKEIDRLNFDFRHKADSQRQTTKSF